MIWYVIWYVTWYVVRYIATCRRALSHTVGGERVALVS
jgi:hypothetical protein